MRTHWRWPWIAALTIVVPSLIFGDDVSPVVPPTVDHGFVSLFDGKSLTGWRSADPSYWTAADGAITGRITREHPCTVNQYLFWTGTAAAPGGQLADFELKLKSRVNGRGGINNGFQFRSRLLPDSDMAGYQVDNNLGTDWLVRLYDEFGRHTLALRGERSTFDAQGKKTTSRLEGTPLEAGFKLEEWHEYHLICVGEKITLKVNDRLVAEVIDHDPRRSDLHGLLGLQLHSGPETVVQFKDIRLKILKAATVNPESQSRSDREREKLLATAIARWDLGAGGHGGTYPLRQAADFYGLEFDVRATHTGSRPGSKVCQFRGGYLAGPKNFPMEITNWTYYVRFLLQPGVTRGTLLAKGSSDDSPLLIAVQPRVDPFQARSAEVLVQLRDAKQAQPTRVRLTADGEDEWVSLIVARAGNRTTAYLRPSNTQRSILVGDVSQLVKSSQPLTIGASSGAKGPVDLLEGELEEIAVWSRGLTLQEIDTLCPIEDRPPPPEIRRPRFRRRPGPLAHN